MIPHSFQEESSAGQTQVWLLGRDATSLSGSWIPNTSEWPNAGEESLPLLSEVLESGPHLKRLFLSSKACLGILRRAKNRGKVLPEMLDRALREQAET